MEPHWTTTQKEVPTPGTGLFDSPWYLEEAFSLIYRIYVYIHILESF